MNSSLALKTPADPLSITLWRPTEEPREVRPEQATDHSTVRWFDLPSKGNAAELYESLDPLCDLLTQEMLEDLLSPDTQPEDVRWGDGRIRFVSTFAAYLTETIVMTGPVLEQVGRCVVG
jgi:hypothetical protein